jgi:hypothetical protein
MSDPDDAPGDGGPDDEELAEMADELSDVLRELRDELRASREARGPEPVEGTTGPAEGGGPDFSIDLPSATDVLAFTDERLIPAAITILEVNIRALELLQKGIRWARPDRAGENARAVQSHAESVSRSTLRRLDTVLADLQDAASEGALPQNAEAGGIITEARRLRDEIDRALEERAEARGDEADPDTIPSEGDAEDEDAPPSPWDDPPEVDVDVEGELQSIKAELGKVDEDDEEADDVEPGIDGEQAPDDESSTDDEPAPDDESEAKDGEGQASEAGTDDEDGADGADEQDDDARIDGERDPATEAENGKDADRGVDGSDRDEGSDRTDGA